MKNFALIVLIVCIGLAIVAFGAGAGFAQGGGSASAELFSPDTTNTATGGDNSVVIAVQGDDNGVKVAYSQTRQEPTPVPVPDNVKQDRSFAGAILMLLAVVVVGFAIMLVLGI